MKWYYSPSKRGFYNDEINAGNIPQDAVEVTEAERAAVREQQRQGKEIVPDQDGKPMAVVTDVHRGHAVNSMEHTKLKQLRQAAIDDLIQRTPEFRARRDAITSRANTLRNNNEDPETGWPE